MVTSIVNSGIAQTNVKSIDLERYSGKWFVIACIPTSFDKHWNYVTETYSVNAKGKIDIYTTYIKHNDPNQKEVRSKGFPDKKCNNTKWKVQFVWPFRADYLIEEIDNNYFYTVAGHPKRKYLYIMNRTGTMGDIQYKEIVDRCAAKGYDVTKIRKVLQ